jgi:hypothetical protein
MKPSAPRPIVIERRKLELRPTKPKSTPKPKVPRPKRRRPIPGAPRMRSGEWDYNSPEDAEDADAYWAVSAPT